MKKEHYIYKITCLCDDYKDKFYIGMHYGELNDDYTGSGVEIKKYFKLFGKIQDVTYKKEILQIGNIKNICRLERLVLYDNIHLPNCLNKYVVSHTGTLGKPMKEETKQKLSKINKERPRPARSDETKKKISVALTNSWKHRR